jgi:flagellar basal-body rod protein FlgF
MDVMAIAGNGMQQDMMRMETISQNLANSLTPGYKKQVLIGISFDQQVSAGLAVAQTAAPLVIDPTPGTFRYTGQALDVAVTGSEFFEVAGPDGPSYTRQGSFHTDLRGQLVTAQGMPVMGMNGELIVTGAFTIDPNGDIRQGDQVVGRLKLVNFANPGVLIPVGGGLYRQGAATLAEQGRAPTLRIGYQENSNVSSPQEMVRLTETVRHFEALQKIMQGYDETLEKTIRKLGEF